MSDRPGVSVYFDDLSIYSNSIEENDHVLKKVFRAHKCNIKFNLNKFQYCKSELKYLGVKFFKEGMLPDPEKIELIRQLQTPSNKMELKRVNYSRQCCCMVNCLRQFIPKLTDISSLLRVVDKRIFNAIGQKITPKSEADHI